MDEFRLEDDLTSNARDHRPSGSNKSSGLPGMAVFRQYLMTGAGILVLLLLIIGIGFALRAPTGHEMAQKNLNTELKTITLSELPTPDPDATATGDNITKITNSAQLQDITVPLIAQTPTQAMHQPVSQNQIKRVELPGSIGNALSLQQNSLDAVSQKMRDTPASPGQGRFTLQLSGASKFNTLDAFAKQQKLTDYHINETKRAGKPWFVLVSGDYASLSAAKKAITTLPADVQTKKPWVRSAVQ